MLALWAKTNPKHYHRRSGIRTLVSHVSNVPWFGKACPPECPGLGPHATFEPMEPFWARSPDELRARQAAVR